MKSIKRWLISNYFEFKKRRYYKSEKAKSTDSSQLGESRVMEFILDSFNRKGYNIPKNFLEIGASYFYHLSNSWYLEKKLLFKGVSIDPLSELEKEFTMFRENTKFIPAAYVDSSYKGQSIKFYECKDNGMLSSVDKENFLRMQDLGHQFVEIDCDVIRTSDIKNMFNTRIGILILDIESINIQLSILKEITSDQSLKPIMICVETLDIADDSDSYRKTFDDYLLQNYTCIASTYLNCIYISNELLK
tara:strand:+ start:1358 stop:2098 length:741 start_codon:yes stop_codon:yes gene_type:complete